MKKTIIAFFISSTLLLTACSNQTSNTEQLHEAPSFSTQSTTYISMGWFNLDDAEVLIGTNDVNLMHFWIKVSWADVKMKMAIQWNENFDATHITSLSLIQTTNQVSVVLQTLPGSAINNNSIVFDDNLIFQQDTGNKLYLQVNIQDDTNIIGDKIYTKLTGATAIDLDSGEEVPIEWVPLSSSNAVMLIGNNPAIGTLSTYTNNSHPEVLTTELILGGTYSDIISVFELQADDEDIMIEDLSLIADENNWSYDFENHIQTLSIYDENLSLIDISVVTNGTVEFNNINMIIEEWSEIIYVVAEAHLIWYAQPWTESGPMRLTMKIDDAEWVDSWLEPVLNESANQTESTDFAVVSVLIVNVVNSNWNCLASPCFLPLTSIDTAKFKVTAIDWDNTTLASPGEELETVLNDFTFKLFTSNITSADYTLKRVNPVNSTANEIVWVVVWNTLTFSNLETTAGTWNAANAEIDGTIEYTIVVTNIVETNAASDTSLSLSFDAGITDSVTYSSDDIGANQINYIFDEDEELGSWLNDN